MHHRYLAALLNAPHLITPSAAAAVLHVLAPGARMEGFAGEPATEERAARPYQLIGSTAVIPVIGEMVHRAGGMKAMSGVTSYLDLGRMIGQAIADPAVSALVFEFDTPGGQGAGCLDLAARLMAFRGTKPMVASVNVQACSAGYALAAACDKIYVTPDSLTGSIGVVACHTDISGALDDAGVKVTYLYAGARKIDGAPEQPLSADARAAFMAVIDATYDRFCAHVAAARGLSIDAVRATEAAILRGADAVSAGLADGIATLEEVIAMTTTPAGPAVPAPPSPPTPTPQALAPAAVASACAAAGFPDLCARLLASPQTDASLNDALAAATATVASGETLGLSDLARQLVTAGMTGEAADKFLLAAKAKVDGAVVTDPTRPAGAPPAKPATGLDAAAVYQQFNSPGARR